MPKRSIYDTVIGQETPYSSEPSNSPTAIKKSRSIYDYEPYDSFNVGAYGRIGLGESKHDWGINRYNAYALQDIRAAHQTSGEQFLHAITQALVGQILGGSLEGIGYLTDVSDWGKALTGKYSIEDEFGNWLSNAGKELQTWVEEKTPIYVDPDQAKFAPGHFSWWAKNFPSVASTLSLMLPAVGATRGIVAAGKAIGLLDEAAAISKLTKLGMDVGKATRAVGKLEFAATGITQASISRYMESMMESRQVYEQSYNDAIASGKTPQEAIEIAGRAAANAYKLNSVILLQDMPQYMLLNRAFGKGVKSLAEKSLRATAMMGKELLPVVGSKAAAISWDMLGEGFEEAYQFVVQQESQHLTDKLLDPTIKSSLDQRLNKYLQDGDLWTSAFFGAMGAGAMQTVGKKVAEWVGGGDPRVNLLKKYGSLFSQAAQAVNSAEILGSESAHKSALHSLESVLFSRGMDMDMMDDVKELIKRSANPTEEDIKRFNINPEDAKSLGSNLDEFLADADYYEQRYNENLNKFGDKSKALNATQSEFTINKFNKLKNTYQNKLQDLQPNIANFNELSPEARNIFDLSAKASALKKKVAFQEKRLADPEMGSFEKKGVQTLIDVANKELKRIQTEIEIIDQSRTPEVKEKDDSTNIGGPHNLLDVKDEKEAANIENHAILEYRKLAEASTWADETLKVAQDRLSKILKDELYKPTVTKEKETQDQVDEDRQYIPEPDDLVDYTLNDTKYNGVVDHIDENGNYVIIPKLPDGSYGTPVTVHKDAVTLNTKNLQDNEVDEEPVDNDEVKPLEVSEPINKASVDVTYYHGNMDGSGNYVGIPEVRNEALHNFLVDPKNTLDGVTAEFVIDSYSEVGKAWFDNNKLSKDNLSIDKLDTWAIDNMPIAIVLVKDGKVLFKGGIYYHVTTYKKSADAENIRKARRFIIENLIAGNKVYSENLQKTYGHFNNTPDSRGNVLDRHGLSMSNARLAVSRKNGRVYKSNADTVANLSSSAPGSIYAPTTKTPDGKERWAKINPTKLTREHAEILWDAIVTRYSWAKGGFMAKFPDGRVEGLTVGEVINMLVLFGDRKTNIDNPTFKKVHAGIKTDHLRNKALYIHNGRELTFGTTTVNIFEDNMAQAQRNKEAFITWAMANKNYSVPLEIRPMGVEINSQLKRTFKLGSWENKADKDGNFMTYAQFLMSSAVDGKNKFAVESDLAEYKDTGSVVVRPHLFLGDTIADIKASQSPDKKAANKKAAAKETPQSKKRKATTKKVKESGTISTAYDIMNLPIGAVIYYESPIVDEGVITNQTERVVIATIDNDRKLGRLLNLSSRTSTTEKWHNIVLDNESEIKSVDAFVSYLKTRPHIPKILVDVSNVAEDKVPEQPTIVTTTVEQPKVAEGQINTGNTLDDLESILNAPLMEAWEGPVRSVINLPKELKWLHNKFGKQNVKDTDTLIRIAHSGRLAFSVFTSDCIYVYTGAPEGALYHEAFHRVMLGYLSESDRQSVYAAARKEYGMPNATYSELDEKLAESFRAYKLSGAKPKSRTLWQKFKDILAFIYTYFTGRTVLTSSDISKLFDSIERGQFKYSEVLEANAKALRGIQTPMAVDIHRTTIQGINNHRDLDKIVKYLTAILIQTNEIDDLNNIKNIKMSKMFDYIDNEDINNPGLIQKLRSVVVNGQKQIESGTIAKDKIEDAKTRLKVSENLLNILTIVISDDYRNLFVDKITDMLSKLNVKRIVDQDAIAESFQDDGYKKFYDKASYEINSKDNILASVKFIIATLPKSRGLDANIGISEFVDFNEMWNSIMHNLWDISSTDEMMDRLNNLIDQYSYTKLVEKLNADKTGLLKEQLRTSVMRHRHDFINFIVNVSKGEGISIDIASADVSSAAKRKVLEWNLFFYGSEAIEDINLSGAKIDLAFTTAVFNKYKDLSSRINKEYDKNGSFADHEKILDEFIELLNSIGIDADKLSVQQLVDKRSGENKDDKLRQLIDADFSWVFDKISNASKHNVIQIFSDEKAVARLAEAYVSSHPEEISDSILGPGGNLYYVYSQNSYITDKIKQYKLDKSFLEDHSNKTYNDNSYYIPQLLDDEIRKNFGVKTFSFFGKGDGTDYLNINPIEDYVFKLTAFRRGLIPFPTMADRQTYYILKGLKPYDFKYSVDNAGNLVLPEDVVDIFVGYAKSERNRIEKARKLILDYNAARESGNKELINQFERQLIDGYHYVLRGKSKDTSKASALQYHHFLSLNDKVKEDGFDFDRDIRSIVKQTILDNIEEELKYAADLGIIGVSSHRATTAYYNRLLDSRLVEEEKNKYGDADKAVRNIIAYNFVNSTISAIETEKLFSGDPAFYKVGKDTGRVHEDKVKRLAVLTSTGDNFADTVPSKDLNDSTYNVVTLRTQKFKSIYYDTMYDWYSDKKEKELKEEYAKEGIEKSSKEILNKAREWATDKLSKYLELDPTDGQVWISPDMYRSLSIRLGEWSSVKDEAFNLLQSGRELTLEEEQKILDVTFQPLKLVYFNLQHEGDLAIPTYDKASFATIFRTITTGKYGNRQISELLDRMELKGKYASDKLQKVDMFKMDSAVKVGNRKATYALDDNFEQINDLSDVEIYQQSYSGLRRQLTTDAHDVDRVKTGTQFLKIVLANLNLTDEVYKLDGKKVDGKKIADIAFSALRSLSNKGREELERRLGYSNGKIDKVKFIEMLAEDAKKSGASDNLVDALTAIGDDLYLELDALTDHKWIQSRIVSLISKYTIDINLPGNQLIQFSNFGMRSIKSNFKLEEELKDEDKHINWVQKGTDDLQWMTLENGEVVPMGCIVSINLFKHIIPNYSNITFKEKIAYLKDNPELMGYRIPTQGHNSIMMLKVMGVYPETIGDTITLPSEFTTLTGSDFDIDKLYVARYNYVVSADKLEKVKFIDGDTNDESVLKAIYKAKYGKLIGKWEWLNKISEGENLKDKEIELLSQMADLTDSQAVEDAIIRIRTKGKYDKNALDKLNEYVKSLPSEDQFIATNKGKDIYSINSRKAVENRLLDAFFAVMRSDEHYDETSAPLGGLTDKLKKKARAIRKALEITRTDLYYASPRYNEYVKDIYTTGKGGVGPFALNNNHHVLGQLADLKMKASFSNVLYEDNGQIDLSRKEGKDGVDILDWLSALIEAHVDVAKDPYITDLNVNSYTYNVVALLLRGGLGEQTFDFVSQPIIKELAREYILSNDRNNTLTKKLEADSGEVDGDGRPIIKEFEGNRKAVDYIRFKWEQMYIKSGGSLEDLKTINNKEVFGQTLSKDMVTPYANNKDFLKRQLAVLDAFIELRALGNDLNTLIQASQIDTKKFGSNIVSIRAFVNKIRRAYDINRFVNIEKILPYDPERTEEINIDGANFLGAYANNSISFALKLFSELSIYGTDSFNELFNKLLTFTGNNYTIDEKIINSLSDELFAAIVSKFFTGDNYVGINKSESLKALFESTLHTLARIKSIRNPEFADVRNNPFIKMLYVQDSKSNLFPFKVFISIPNKSSKDKIDKDTLISSFQELLKHDNAEVRNFARRLVYFSFFTSGFTKRLYSFFNFIPNELMREMKVKDPTNPQVMLDKSYNDFIKSTLISMKDVTNSVNYLSLIDEVILNNHHNDNIVRLLRGRSVDLQYSYNNKNYTTPVAAIVSGVVSNSLKIGQTDTVGIDKKVIYRPYIKVADRSLGYVVMRYIGYISVDTIREGALEVTNEVKPVYIATNMRGFTSKGTVLREYGLNKSMIDAYNNLEVVKNEEEYLKSLAGNEGTYTYVPKSEQMVVLRELDVEQNDEGEQDNGMQKEWERQEEKVVGETPTPKETYTHIKNPTIDDIIELNPVGSVVDVIFDIKDKDIEVKAEILRIQSALGKDKNGEYINDDIEIDLKNVKTGKLYQFMVYPNGDVSQTLSEKGKLSVGGFTQIYFNTFRKESAQQDLFSNLDDTENEKLRKRYGHCKLD